MTKIIAVDLDGTLSKTTTDGSIGDPIKAMVDRVNAWHAAGREVVVFTARNNGEWRKIDAWLKLNGLPALNVTNIKIAEFSEIWDNRAIRVDTDSGEACSKCVSAAKKSLNHSANFTVTDC